MGIVKDRAVRMHYGIAKLSSLMNRPGCFSGNMAGDATREGKLFEEPFHSFFVLRNVWIELAVGSLQISIRNQAWSTVSWTSNVDYVQVMQLNQSIEMNVDEV